jgi:hypothetical protein
MYTQVLEATGTATLFVDLKTHSEEAIDAYVSASLRVSLLCLYLLHSLPPSPCSNPPAVPSLSHTDML